MSEPTRFEALRQHVADLAIAADGVWTVAIVRGPDGYPLCDAANAGDATASRVLLAAADAIKQTRADPIPCLLCDRICSTEAMPTAIVVLLPDGHECDGAVTHAVCPAAPLRPTSRCERRRWTGIGGT